MPRFLCRLIGHDWGWFSNAQVVGARIEIAHLGQHGDNPALTYITHYKEYLSLCKRCDQERVKELIAGTNEEWAR